MIVCVIQKLGVTRIPQILSLYDKLSLPQQKWGNYPVIPIYCFRDAAQKIEIAVCSGLIHPALN